MITVPLEVNLAWYSPLFQSHTEVILGLLKAEEIAFCIQLVCIMAHKTEEENNAHKQS